MWQNPHRALAQFDFAATTPQEISFRANQVVTIAPEAQQGSLWNSGWLLATVDNKTSGFIPANYVKLFRTAPLPQPTANNAQIPQQPQESISEESDESYESDTPITSNVPISSKPLPVFPNLPTASINQVVDTSHNNTGDAGANLQKLVLNAQPEVVDFDKCFESSKSSE